MTRKGPGLLYRDILSGTDPQISAAASVIHRASPDILTLTAFDYDAEGLAIHAFADVIASRGTFYPTIVQRPTNAGSPSLLDLNGDGTGGGPGDTQGYGGYPGRGAIAVLARFPLAAGVRDFTHLLWRDLPDAGMPFVDGAPFPSAEAHEAQRLSSTSHWMVPLDVSGFGSVDLWVFSATPPVFDGPEDRNGLRNHDETAFWLRALEGAFGPVPDHFVLAGTINADPFDGEARRGALRALLSHVELQDPRPGSAGARRAAKQGGANDRHRGPAHLDTVDWRDEPGPGNLRVDYVLPSRSLHVTGAGVVWPDPETDPSGARDVQRASRHRLVWVDIDKAGSR
ncbi:MAG: endonuclease/exonuclease/phosphatase family protein [Pseudomonadota bacterium]